VGAGEEVKLNECSIAIPRLEISQPLSWQRYVNAAPPMWKSPTASQFFSRDWCLIVGPDTLDMPRFVVLFGVSNQ
jgi:hypothetical protein